MKTDLSFGKTGKKNVQLVLQHCCKTSWIAILRVLPPTFKPVNNLICCKTGFLWVVKRAQSLFNWSCSNVAGQVACSFFGPFYRTLILLLELFSSHLASQIPSSVSSSFICALCFSCFSGDWTWKRRRACFCYLDYLINTQSLFIFIVLSSVFWAVGC